MKIVFRIIQHSFSFFHSCSPTHYQKKPFNSDFRVVNYHNVYKLVIILNHMDPILTVKEAKKKLTPPAPDLKAIVAEAKKLGLDQSIIRRIKERINPGESDCYRGDFYDDFSRGAVSEDVPISSEGRLSYNLRLDPVRVPTVQVGWSDDDKNYSGQNLVVRNQRIYLLGADFLPVVNGYVHLDLSNAPKLFGREPDHPQITREEAAQLISQASTVIDLLLQNPNCRCSDPYYGGYHAADLTLSFDAYTSGLRTHFVGFKTASSQVNGELAFGTLERTLSRAEDKASLVLVREGRSDCGSSVQQLGYAAAAAFRG